MSGTAHSLTLRRGPGTSILGKWNEQGSWQSTAEFGHASCFICFYPPKKHPLLKNVNGKHPHSTATSFRPSRGARQGVASLEGAAWLICIQTEKGIQKPGMILIIFWHQNYQFWFKNIPSINFEDSRHILSILGILFGSWDLNRGRSCATDFQVANLWQPLALAGTWNPFGIWRSTRWI